MSCILNTTEVTQSFNTPFKSRFYFSIGTLRAVRERAHADARTGDGTLSRPQLRRPLRLVLRLRQLRTQPGNSFYSCNLAGFGGLLRLL